MLENIKNFISFNYVDKCIGDRKYDLAMEKLNKLINDDFKPADTYLKRGMLCHKLLMLEEAYSDFTYIINNCVKKQRAYYERMKLNYEIGNYYEAVFDANKILEDIPENTECLKYKFLSYTMAEQIDMAKCIAGDMFNNNKYKSLQFIFNETAKCIAQDEFSKGLKLLQVIDMIDPDNPIMILKKANIYGLAGDKEKEAELINKINAVFPKYFISHFRFTDMYENRDYAEVCFLLELKIFDRQSNFDYPMCILEGYKAQMEGHIIDSKEAFEHAIKINPDKPEGYVLLAQTLQLMSGYDNPSYKEEAELNYKKAMAIYQNENLTAKAEDMKRQIRHLNAKLSIR